MHRINVQLGKIHLMRRRCQEHEAPRAEIQITIFWQLQDELTDQGCEHTIADNGAGKALGRHDLRRHIY